MYNIMKYLFSYPLGVAKSLLMKQYEMLRPVSHKHHATFYTTRRSLQQGVTLKCSYKSLLISLV